MWELIKNLLLSLQGSYTVSQSAGTAGGPARFPQLMANGSPVSGAQPPQGPGSRIPNLSSSREVTWFGQKNTDSGQNVPDGGRQSTKNHNKLRKGIIFLNRFQR